MAISRFLRQNFAGCREWHDIFKVLKIKEKKPANQEYLAKVLYKVEGKRIFPDKAERVYLPYKKC